MLCNVRFHRTHGYWRLRIRLPSSLKNNSSWRILARRRWLDDASYTDLVALCQFLPGPASSQVGFSLGLMRAGYLGDLAAWIGFTLPSAIALVLFAYGAHALGGPVGIGMLHGLKLVAVAIVAQAVWGMARTLCPDRERASIALVAALIVVFLHRSSVSQIAAIVAGAVSGIWLCRSNMPAPTGTIAVPVSRRVGIVSLVSFFLLLIGLPLLRELTSSSAVALIRCFLSFRRTGIRRWTRGAATVTGCVRGTRMGER